MFPQFCQSLLNPLACAIESELNAIYNVPGYKRQDGLLKHPAVFSDKKTLGITLASSRHTCAFKLHCGAFTQ